MLRRLHLVFGKWRRNQRDMLLRFDLAHNGNSHKESQ